MRFGLRVGFRLHSLCSINSARIAKAQCLPFVFHLNSLAFLELGAQSHADPWVEETCTSLNTCKSMDHDDTKMRTRSVFAARFDDGNHGISMLSAEKAGTTFDQRDMARVGKTQELRRKFGFISIMGFTAVPMCTWEAVLHTSSHGSTNGGFAGLVWM